MSEDTAKRKGDAEGASEESTTIQSSADLPSGTAQVGVKRRYSPAGLQRERSGSTVLSRQSSKLRHEELVTTPKGGRFQKGSFSAPQDLRKRAWEHGSLNHDQGVLLSFRGVPGSTHRPGGGVSSPLSRRNLGPSTPLSAERRAARLGAELNLATPAGFRTKKTLRSVPVPKAWSNFVLNGDEDDGEKEASSLAVSEASAVTQQAASSSPLVREAPEEEYQKIRKLNEQLELANKALQMENAQLRGRIGSEDTGLTSPTYRTLQSALFRQGSNNLTELLGFGHPDSEGILRAENNEADDDDTLTLKSVTRQLFSLSVHVKALEHTLKQDKLELARVFEHARRLQSSLEASEARNRQLERRIAELSSNGQSASSE